MVSEAERNERRRRAGERAATFVEDGMVVGLGTGRTADHATRALAARVAAGLRIVGVPTSHRTALLASSLGITIGSPEEHPRLDIAIDGADEVDPQLRLIKGLGGALLREKIVARSSKQLIIIVDSSKMVPRLGTRSPLPVEVVPFACSLVRHHLLDEGLRAELRRDADTGGPYETDNGNLILDCHFPDGIDDPVRTESRINALPGVVENGLFIDLADLVIVGEENGGCRQLHRSDP